MTQLHSICYFTRSWNSFIKGLKESNECKSEFSYIYSLYK